MTERVSMYGRDLSGGVTTGSRNTDRRPLFAMRTAVLPLAHPWQELRVTTGSE